MVANTDKVDIKAHPLTNSTQKADLLKTKTRNKTVFNKYWIKGVGILISHVVALISLFWVREVESKFIIAAVASGFLKALGICAGYHRLWSHKAYVASLPLKVFLSLLGAASWQGSIRWWVLRHRMHHRFVDTKYDPYDSTRGLWFSHFGWLFEKPCFYEKTSIIDMSDIDADVVCQWNRKYTPHFVIGLGLILPIFIGALMGSMLAGFICIGVWGRIIAWNGIFAINSFGHYSLVGGKYYSDTSSATTSLFFAILSNGEGNHNYHHEFPHDYRHGVRWIDYDPTKWFIWTCSLLGLASSLKTVEAHVRKERELQVEIAGEMQSLDRKMSKHVKHMAKTSEKLPVPTPPEALPVIRQQDIPSSYRTAKEAGLTIIQIDNYLVDVTEFRGDHPGGVALLEAFHLKDATKMFYGGRNIHTRAAQNIFKRLRIARIVTEGEKTPPSYTGKKSAAVSITHRARSVKAAI